MSPCCQGSTEEGTHSWYMSPMSRKEHDSIWIKATVPGASAELQAAVGSHARRRTSFPRRGCVLHASPGPGGAMGKAVNTKRMKSTGKKSTRENYAKWKVTKYKQGGDRPGFSPRALPGHRAVPMVLCSLALCSSLPRPLLLQSLAWTPRQLGSFVSLDK